MPVDTVDLPDTAFDASGASADEEAVFVTIPESMSDCVIAWDAVPVAVSPGASCVRSRAILPIPFIESSQVTLRSVTLPVFVTLTVYLISVPGFAASPVMDVLSAVLTVFIAAFLSMTVEAEDEAASEPPWESVPPHSFS